MNNSTVHPFKDARNGVGIKSASLFQRLHKLVVPGLALLAAGWLMPMTAQAQFVHIKASQTYVTVPVNTTLSTVVTNLVSLSGINSSGAALNVVGLPAGAGATLSTSVVTASGAVNITIGTTNVAEGNYTFGLTASATDTNGNPQTNILLYTLQVGYIWNGGTNVAVSGSSLLTPGTWLGGTPGAGDDLVFGDLGSQTNSLINLILTPNIIIGANTTNASARFNQTNSTTKFYTIQITNGATWALTGTNGFSLLRDFVDNYAAISGGQTVTIFGTNGATMMVSNEQANVALLIDNGITYTLDLSGLDNFAADINQFNLGDYTGYPNFFNIDENSANNAGVTGGVPRQFLGAINWAKTNVIKAVFADPFHYTNSDSRRYSLSYMNSELSGSSTAPLFNLGISNLFMLDSVCFTGGNSRGNLQFNPSFLVTTNVVGSVTNLTTNNMIAVFRGTNGGRMSMFCISDGGGTNTANSNIKATINFGTSQGTLDVLTDQLIIGRDRKLIVTNGTPNYQGFLTMGKGIIDVNTAIFGFREHVITNTTPPTIGTLPLFNGYCEGQFTIISNGVLKVNQSLTLGSTVETLSQGLGSGGNTEYGEVTIENGGTLIANQINVGGPVYGASLNNFIVISNNSTMIISNTIGGPLQSLDKLTFNNSTNVMNIDGANPGPYIYATNLTTANVNTIRIGSIKNLGLITGPIQLIQFSAGGGSFQNLIMPSGVGGALLTTNNVGIYLTILTNTPKNIVWRGFSSQDWDLTTANWLDLSTGLHTNFSSGDFVSFDDAAGVPTTVHLAGTIDIIPGSIGMTNNINAYIIDSSPTDGADSGVIKGSATLNKSGTNSVEIDGTTSLNVLLAQGIMTGSGTIGSANVTAGTTMNFAGTVVNGVTCAGVATLSGSGSTGNIVVQSTGIVTNAGTFIGSFSMSSGALLYNSGVFGASDTASWTAVGNPIVPSGATFINAGDIHTMTLTVNGTFEDKGTGTLYVNGDVVTGTRGVTIASGGVFIPGGDGIGTTTINEDNSPNNFPGRLLFSTGSTNIFKIDPSGPANTEVLTIYMGWGPNESAPTINGGTVVISNTTGASFQAGQTYTLVGETFSGIGLLNASTNTTNAQPIIIPSSPGAGLAWDESALVLTGVLGVRSVTTTPTNLLVNNTFSTVVATNSSGTPTGTNQVITTELHWPTNYLGWELQEDSATLTNGVSQAASNWTTIPGSSFTNDVLITNNVTKNSALFFRMIYP